MIWCFASVTDETVQNIILDLNSCTCSLDEPPTTFLKSVLNSLLQQFTELAKISLQTGTFPKALKVAVIKPLLKKNSLDPVVLSNYRPISNLPFLGKVLEKVVYIQHTASLSAHIFFNAFQSDFRPTIAQIQP